MSAEPEPDRWYGIGAIAVGEMPVEVFYPGYARQYAEPGKVMRWKFPKHLTMDVCSGPVRTSGRIGLHFMVTCLITYTDEGKPRAAMEFGEGPRTVLPGDQVAVMAPGDR